MKRLLLWPCLLGLILIAPVCRLQDPYPDDPGVLFIHQQICDLGDFKKTFFNPKNDLKGRGFLAYSFHRDLLDPGAYILAFKCADLKKAVEFIRTSNFITACVGAGGGLPLLWAGIEEEGRPDQNFPELPGGQVVVRLEVRNYGLWKKSWDVDGKQDFLGSKTKTGVSGQYRLASNPGVVIVTYELPDINRIRGFMTSKGMISAMEAAGVTHHDFWIGTNLEEGSF